MYDADRARFPVADQGTLYMLEVRGPPFSGVGFIPRNCSRGAWRCTQSSANVSPLQDLLRREVHLWMEGTAAGGQKRPFGVCRERGRSRARRGLGVNNALARTASLLAVDLLGTALSAIFVDRVAGQTGEACSVK